MALKELQIRGLRPTDKIYQCTDDRGLYLEVHPNGSKLWRYKYRHAGKQKRLALGRYPDIGLAEARRRRDDARRKLEAGNDPLAERKHDKLVAAFKAANSFGDVAKEYIDKMVAEGRADTTTTKANWLLEQLAPIAARPVADLRPIDVLATLKRLEAKGKHETARRCRSFASRVFRYAVATGRGETDPTSILRGALIAPKVTHHAAILEPEQVGELLRAIDGYSGHTVTRIAMQIAPHVVSGIWRRLRRPWPALRASSGNGARRDAPNLQDRWRGLMRAGGARERRPLTCTGEHSSQRRSRQCHEAAAVYRRRWRLTRSCAKLQANHPCGTRSTKNEA